MTGNAGRNKGMNGEREIVRMLQPHVDTIYSKYGILEIPLLERNTLQCNQGGSDIAGLDWMALEIKRQEIVHLEKWWEQTTQQCKTHQVPVLLYRQNRGKWRCQLHGALLSNFAFAHNLHIDAIQQNIVITKVDISIESFIDWFVNKVEYELLLKLKQQNLNFKSWPPMAPTE